MNKSVAGTFIAAAVLVVVSLSINFYGQSIVESQRLAGEGQFTAYDVCGSQLDPWEQASGIFGLMAFSTSIAGAMFWYREQDPIAEQSSILMLGERTATGTVRMAAPPKDAAIAKAHVDQSHERRHEDESLTPLERVIRGY